MSVNNMFYPKSAEIIITYYVNPHMFWFKYKDTLINESEISKNEEIQRLGHLSRNTKHSPKVGEIVIVHYTSDSVDKWVRARVDHCFSYLQESEFYLWAIDEGFPIRCNNSRIRELKSKDLRNDVSQHIFKASLNTVVPAIRHWNPVTSNVETVKTLTWSVKCFDKVEDLLTKADSVFFICDSHIDEYHLIGTVTLKFREKLLSLAYLLKEYFEAVDSSGNFKMDYRCLPQKAYWEQEGIKKDGDRKTYIKVIFNEIKKPTISEINSQKLVSWAFERALERESRYTTIHNRRILIHTHESIALTSISSIAEAHFADEVHADLKSRGFQAPFRTQSYGWPHLMRGNSLIVVNSAKTAKTWTYLPAVCSLIRERISDNRIVEGDGPVVIILCTNSTKVDNVVHHCRKLLQGSLISTTCIGAYGQREHQKVVNELLNGVHILVATVPCMVRLMHNDLKLFNRSRIKTFVIDDMDAMIDQFGIESVNQIYHAFLTDTNADLQVVVTTRTWHSFLKKFCQRKDILLCIGAYIEAAIYAKAEMSVKSINQYNQKEEFLSGIKRVNYSYEQTIVICNQITEVDELVKILRYENISTNSCHELTDPSEIARIKSSLRNNQTGSFTVLVCTDDVLLDLDVRHGQHLIHYSLPSCWTSFTQRFSVSFDCYRNIFQKNTTTGVPSSLIFVSEESLDALPRIVEFMRMRCLADVPKHVLELVEKKRIEREEKRLTKYNPFCTELINLGVCRSEATSSCTARHVLTKFDRPLENIPRNGKVKFQIIAIRTPVHFTVRLLEHLPLYQNKWQKIPLVDEYVVFQMDFTSYFNNPDNHKIHHPPELGNLCAIDTDTRGYQRCKIIGIEQTNLLNTLRLLMIDTNEQTSCKSTDILELPSRFKNLPPQAVDLRISGIIPHDSDTNWDRKTTVNVGNWLQYNNDNVHLEGLIQLTLMDCIWVTSIDVIERLSSINQAIMSMSIKESLIKKKFGVSDNKGLLLLQDMATKAGILDTRPHTLERFIAIANSDTQRRGRRGKKCTERPKHNSISEFVECIKLVNNSDQIHDIKPLNPSCSIKKKWSSSSDSIVHINDYSYNALNSSSCESSVEPHREKWVELTPNRPYKVKIGTFYSPDRIFVQKYHNCLYELSKSIDKFAENLCNLKPLVQIKINKICLAKLDGNYNRAKIINVISDSTVEVFFVDLGYFETLPPKDIVDIPEQFVKQAPFQTIHCKFIGIVPSQNSDTWPVSTADIIYEKVLSKCADIFVRPIEQNRAGEICDNELNCHSYNAVFEDKIFGNINNLLVSNAFAEYDTTTKHFLDVLIDRRLLEAHEDSVEEDWDDDDSVPSFDANLLLQNIEYKNLFEANKETDKVFDFNKFDEEDICNFFQLSSERTSTSISKYKSLQASDGTQKNNKLSTKPLKKTIVRHKNNQLIQHNITPHIIWDQSNEVIMLDISAPDISDYYLKVGLRYVYVCYSKEDKKYAVILNLYGCVDVNYTSHEIRGLNVVVRLLKSLPGLVWPRLIQSSDKNQFIKPKITENFDEHNNCLVQNDDWRKNISSSDSEDYDSNLSNDGDDIEV